MLFSKALAQVTTGVYRVLVDRDEQGAASINAMSRAGYMLGQCCHQWLSDRGRRKASGNPTVAAAGNRRRRFDRPCRKRHSGSK